MNPDEIILSIIPAFDVTLLEYNSLYSLYLTSGSLPRNRLTRHIQGIVDLDDVLQRVEEARLQPKLMWVSEDDRLRMDRIGEPQKIGPWWLNRFIRLPEGYRIDVDYKLVPKQNRKRKRG